MLYVAMSHRCVSRIKQNKEFDLSENVLSRAYGFKCQPYSWHTLLFVNPLC